MSSERSEQAVKSQIDVGSSMPEVHPWEAAYLRMETPEQEIQKFVRRLRKLGAQEWPRNSEIVELFCGRGNGLHALERLGFTRLEGADLSPRLLAQYRGQAKCYEADCRQLPFADASKDILIVQGGLHHLPNLPEDLERTVAEMHRVVRPGGRLMIVEPWSTPFLTVAHLVSENPVARRLSNKLDALAIMIHYERRTYEQWLSQPELIAGVVHRNFVALKEWFGRGKWNFLGKPA